MLAGCGYTGPPQPPALYVPDRITDMHLEVSGDKIIVHFTTPLLTGERLAVTKLRAIELAIGPGDAEFSKDRWAATAQRYVIPADELGPRDFAFPVVDWAGNVVVVGMRTTGQSGRMSEWSNLEILNVRAPLAKPRLEAPRATAKGVALAVVGRCAEVSRVAGGIGGSGTETRNSG